MNKALAFLALVLGAGVSALAYDIPESGGTVNAAAAETIGIGDIVGMNSTGCLQVVTCETAMPSVALTAAGKAPASYAAGETAAARPGVYRLPNYGGSVTSANYGATGYWKWTSAETNGVSTAAGTPSVTLGTILWVDEHGVWVRIGK